jgi:diacylglycerol kinase (ATP)
VVAIGAHRGREDVVYIRGKSIHVDSPEKVPLQIDGEAAGFTPLQVDVLPASVSFLVPT